LFGHGSTSVDVNCRGAEGWVWGLECKGPKGNMTKHASIWGEAYLGFYVEECPMFPKYW